MKIDTELKNLAIKMKKFCDKFDYLNCKHCKYSDDCETISKNLCDLTIQELEQELNEVRLKDEELRQSTQSSQ